jgi:hypothetical protein
VDVVHTLIRIPAGAALAASVFGDSSQAMMLAAAIPRRQRSRPEAISTKAGSRAVINTSARAVLELGGISHRGRRSGRPCCGSRSRTACGRGVVVLC